METGEGTFISPLASIHGGERITVGKNCRIDDFVVLSAGEGGIEIGDNVHIGCGSTLIGSAKITLADNVGLSGGVRIYSSSGDMSKMGSSGSPCRPEERARAVSLPVVLMHGSTVGANAVILPGVTIGVDAVVGALSLVPMKSRLVDGVYAGTPVRFIKHRS